MFNGHLVIYGASGYTGRLVARAAKERGLSVVLAGRDRSAIEAVAKQLEMPFVVASVGDERALAAALSGACAVVNAAGPFGSTAGPIVDVCLRLGVHYLDVTAEVPVLDALSRRAAEARRARVMIMPSVGFDVVASDCLVARAVARRPRAKALHIGISGLELLSRGSAKTMAAQMGEPAWIRRAGVLEGAPPASIARTFDFGAGPAEAMAVSWGDVVTAYVSTGVPDITVYFEADPVRRMIAATAGAIGKLPAAGAFRSWARAWAAAMPDGPAAEERARRNATVVVEAEDATGGVARSRLRAPEAYSFTSSSAVSVAERVLAGDIEPGFQTPSRVYGPDLVLAVPGVTVQDA